ncbi:ChaN family lipoprotein [Aureibacter tunicatorum]|uniref:Iron-regulated protein n=1 Tax=Aureibacter tunicatorum TaxID=866807 RepID=A0AAE4BQW4_9BACT|nr:ChaN family lipoprotein [Aureibacter tunicatorum]MDR6238016.1 putative iron-regulated protein [Aureibacter tunicatorum]BDD03049.1 hypothetical protein AUTU_05320 [Aureibacter tunicatorum]
MTYKNAVLFWIICLTFGFTAIANGQNPEAYKLFDSKGKKAKYIKMMKELADADVVMFGELHDNTINHWLEFKVLESLHKAKGDKVIVGAEMFESDDQLLIDEYFSELISKKSFQKEARLWDEYKTDYRPLLEYAKTNNLQFVATNIPRRYASLVYKKGINYLDSLSDEAKSYIAPLPIEIDLELPCYKNMMGMMKGHGGENLPKSQAVKDATMAYFILKNLKEEDIFIHYNGDYHSKNHEGIVWYLQQANPDLKVVTISTVLQDDIEKLNEEFHNQADYILCIPNDMTRSYTRD